MTTAYTSAIGAAASLLMLVQTSLVPGAPMSETTREFTLDHRRPDSRTRWRIPEIYLSLRFDWQPTTGPTTSLIVIDATLPAMTPWRRSGLDINRENDMARYISITLESSSDFAIEKRTIPRILNDTLHFVGEYNDTLNKYFDVRKRGGKVADVPPEVYLLPKEPTPGKAIYFRCERRCIAYADFSETVIMHYDLTLQYLDDWSDFDRKVRDLLTKFIVP